MMSVVLLACNSTTQLNDLTRETLDSIKPCEELIVVDNASVIGGGMLRATAPIYIRNEQNIGYPAAVNQGVKLSHGEFIAIANNDIRVSSGWEGIATDIFEDDTVGSVHFQMIPYTQPFTLGTDTWVGGKERWCHASFFVVRKAAFEDVGGYFEGYTKGGYDDYDFFHQMREIHGWTQAYTNKAAFQHQDSSTYRQLDLEDGDRARRDATNRELYKKRWGEYPDVQFAQLFPDQVTKEYRPFP